MRDIIQPDDQYIYIMQKRDDDPPQTLETCYEKVRLAKGEKERVIGFTFAINSHGLPQEIAIEDPKCYAKMWMYKEGGEEKRKFFIKQDRSGYIYNPMGMYEENNENQRGLNKTELRWTLQETKPQSFWYYLLFLQTRREIYLNHAARYHT